jgi:hypothetical protein
MINELLSKIGDDVVLVDIINIAYLGEGGSQAILYKKGTTVLLIPLPNITLQAIERWVEKNLGTQENYDEALTQRRSCKRSRGADSALDAPLQPRITLINLGKGSNHILPDGSGTSNTNTRHSYQWRAIDREPSCRVLPKLDNTVSWPGSCWQLSVFDSRCREPGYRSLLRKAAEK